MEQTGKATSWPSRGTMVFCEKPWEVLALGLGILILLTFAWGFFLLDTYSDDDYFAEAGDNAVSRFLFRDTAAPDAAGLAAVISPGVVGVGAAGVNMPTTSTGVIVGADGHVLSTLHSVKGLSEIDVRVATPGGVKRYRAEIVKSHADHNLVLLKILTADRFLFFPIADTSTLLIGSKVFGAGRGAAGNLVIKEGVIRGANAVVAVGTQKLTHLFSTDAVYTWEQNGGPLVNEQGALVGINLTLKGPSGGVSGFAVPAHVILDHFQDVINFKVSKPAAGQAASMPPPKKMPGKMPETTISGESKGSAKWWAKARAQVAPPARPLGMNVVATAGPPLAAGGAQSVAGTPVPIDREHLGVFRLGGYRFENIIALALLGLASGLISGMMTMGGGVLLVAGMMVFFGYGMHLIRPVAYLTNLFVFGAAARRNHRSGLISWPVVRALTPWAVVGVVAGYFIGNSLGDQAISILLGSFALLMTVKGLHEIFGDSPDEMLVRTAPSAGEKGEPAVEDDFLEGVLHIDGGGQAPRQALESHVHKAALGLPVGLISGILGISGGVLSVPLQRFFSGQALRNAIANSSVVVFWASLAGAVVAFSHGLWTGLIEWQAPLKMAAILVPGAFIGGIAGARLMRLLPTITLKWFYTVIMAVIAVKMLFLS